MEKTVLSERLRAAMKMRSLTQQALCQLSGVSQTNLSYILNGRNKSTSADNLNNLAVALGVSVAFLLGTDDSPQQNLIPVKICEWDSSALAFVATTKPPEMYDASELSLKLEECGSLADCIAFIMESDNMYPVICPGDHVIINQADKDIKRSNRPRLFAVYAFDSLAVFRLRVNLNQIKLESINPHVDSISFSVDDFNSSVKVLGRVIDRRGFAF